MKKFSQHIDKKVLVDVELRQPNLVPGLTFAHVLYDSTIRSRPFNEGRRATVIEKLLHSGFGEHAEVCEAFAKAHRVETHITTVPYIKERVNVYIRFYKVNESFPHFGIGLLLYVKTGELEVDFTNPCDDN